MRRAVLRLHRRMSDEGISVSSLDNLSVLKSSFDVTVAPKRSHGLLFRKGFGLTRKTFAALRRRRAFVPFHFQLLARGLCLPPTIGDDRHSAHEPAEIGAAI